MLKCTVLHCMPSTVSSIAITVATGACEANAHSEKQISMAAPPVPILEIASGGARGCVSLVKQATAFASNLRP